MGFLEDAIKAGIGLAGDLADGFIKGEELSASQKRHLASFYFVGKMSFMDIVKDTENDFDDITLQTAIDLAADTLTEGGVTLPVVPDIPDDPAE